MAKLDIFNPVWLDVVFAGRNQSYGAYVLRKENSKTTSKAIIIGGVLFALLISSPIIYKYIKGFVPEDAKPQEATEVVLTPPPPVDEQAPPPPPPAEPPRPKVDQVRFPPPVVVPANEVVDEEPPTQTEMETKNPGPKTIEGDEKNGVEAIEGPVGEAPPTTAAVVEDNSVHDFASIEVQPNPPGGMEKFLQWVGKNYNYPAAAREQGVSGRVIVQFVVEKDGSLTDIKAVRDAGMGTGDEAVRMLKRAPKWKPGIQNGREVRVMYTLPIMLNLEAQ